MTDATWKIAAALETLVERSIVDFEADLNVLNVPVPMREPIWDGIARRAHSKSLECSGRVRP